MIPLAVNTGVNELLIDEVFAAYTTAEEVMLEKLAKSVKASIEGGWAETKMAEIQKMQNELEAELAKIQAKTTEATAKAIISSYLKGVNSANADLKIPKTSLRKLHVPYHIQRLFMDANEIMKGATFRILRETNDVYRAIIADSTSIMLTGVETRLDVAQRALNAFAAKGITGFVDKAGRRWEMASYVEMAVRTASSRAALQGHIDRSSELGHDLMIVSHFGKTCPICAPWEGKVLSISGKDVRYPSLERARAAGLFHPNCRHTLLAYFEGITEIPQLKNDDEYYKAQQVQRYNERQIRKWKRVEAVAMTPAEKAKASSKVKAWQAIQREHIAFWGLRRKYYRESIRNRTGVASNAKFGKQTLKLDDESLKKVQQTALENALPKHEAQIKEKHDATEKLTEGIKGKKKSPKASTFDESKYILIDTTKPYEDVLRDSEIIKKMNDDERKSIEFYSGSGFSDMNDFLRGIESTHDSSIEKWCKILDETIEKYADGLTNDIKVFRHMNIGAMRPIFSDEIGDLAEKAVFYNDLDSLAELKKKVVGGTFKDKAFLSTSYSEGVFVAKYGVEFQLFLPKGYKNGMFIESISKHKTEKEYLIKSNQKFKIVDIDVGMIPFEKYNKNIKVKNIIIKVIPIED